MELVAAADGDESGAGAGAGAWDAAVSQRAVVQAWRLRMVRPSSQVAAEQTEASARQRRDGLVAVGRECVAANIVAVA